MYSYYIKCKFLLSDTFLILKIYIFKFPFVQSEYSSHISLATVIERFK